MKKQICLLDHEDQSIFQLKCLTQSMLLSIFHMREVDSRTREIPVQAFQDASRLPEGVVGGFLSKYLRS